MSPLIRFPTAMFALALCVSPAVGRSGRLDHGDGFVTIRDRELIAPDGKILRLKGINLGGWLVPEGYMFGFSKATAPWQIGQTIKELLGTEANNDFWRRWYGSFITHADIRYIRSTGMNIIRVPFDYRLFTPEDYPGTWVGVGFKLLDRVIHWSAEAGMFVLLDMHAAPCGQNALNVDYGYAHLYDDAACLARAAEVWRRIARHYAENRGVIGYDLLNEPAPPDADGGQAKLDIANKDIAASIREVDKHHLLFVTNVQFNSSFKISNNIHLNHKLVYTFHSYWTEPTDQVFAQHLQFAASNKVPIFLGESGENTDDWVRSFRLALERHDVGWAFWTYKRMETGTSMRSFAKPAYWEELVAYQQTPSDPFSKPKKMRPSAEHARAALEGMLRNSRFNNTHVNAGYIGALGMTP